MADKVYEDARRALDGLLFDGMRIMSGRGLSGNPETLVDQLLQSRELELNPPGRRNPDRACPRRQRGRHSRKDRSGFHVRAASGLIT